jgi:hypothetical protein
MSSANNILLATSHPGLSISLQTNARLPELMRPNVDVRGNFLLSRSARCLLQHHLHFGSEKIRYRQEFRKTPTLLRFACPWLLHSAAYPRTGSTRELRTLHLARTLAGKDQYLLILFRAATALPTRVVVSTGTPRIRR